MSRKWGDMGMANHSALPTYFRVACGLKIT
ncbi:hypothetical protein Daqu01_01212 [Deinococcus aquaticus]